MLKLLLKLTLYAIITVILLICVGVFGLWYFGDKIDKLVPKKNGVEVVQDSVLQKTPPKGFTWYTCKNVEAAFLLPDHWYTLEESGKDAEGCFLTREEIVGKDGQFITGLTINKIADVSKKTNQSVAQYSQALMEEYEHMQKSGAVDTVSPIKEDTNPGDLSTIRLSRFVTKSGHHFYYYNIADTKYDTLYAVIFEGVDPTWAKDYDTIGQTMLEDIIFSQDNHKMLK